MTLVISLPVGDEVKVTQKGDDGHSSAIINSALYSAHGGRNQLCAIMSMVIVELAIQIVCCHLCNCMLNLVMQCCLFKYIC